ncbi:DUF2141 domain-containing protein, partial [candidate division FCPU426 bacterium]|nr:DUF2141 domain-containing protein [candidate division FCPU426 bacterium]
SQPRSKPAEAEGQATPLPLPTPTPVPKIVSLDDIEPEQPLLLAWGNQSNQPQGTLIVNIHGFRNDQGEVRVSLYASPEGFPDKAAKALQKKMVKIESRQAQVVFSNVPFGKYAVSVHHDEDSNAKMKSNWLGMPKEGVGASRDAKGSFGPPRFQNASFDFQDEELIISIRVNYL